MSKLLAISLPTSLIGQLDGIARLFYPHVSLWFLTTAMAVVNLAFIALSARFSVDPLYVTILQLSYGFAVALVALRWVRSQIFDWFLHRLWCACMVLALTFSFATNLAVLNLQVMTQQWPFADQMLMTFDNLVGFDWLAYSKFVTAYEPVSNFLFYMYQDATSFFVMGLPILAVLLNHRVRAYETLFMIFVTGLISVLLASFFPALGPWKLLADSELLARISWTAPVDYVGLINVLRGDDVVHVSLSQYVGLSTCPSYHTCLALCFAIATRGYRGLNVIGLFVCASIIIATPVFGIHYLTDLIAGAALTAVTFYVWIKWVRPLLVPVFKDAGDEAFVLPNALLNFGQKMKRSKTLN